MASRIVRLALAVLLGTALVAVTSPAQAADSRVTITFKAQLANVSNNTSTFGDLQYGTTTLQGASLVKGEEVLVRRDSVVEYVDGTGPIGGFLTVTWKDGSRISHARRRVWCQGVRSDRLHRQPRRVLHGRALEGLRRPRDHARRARRGPWRSRGLHVPRDPHEDRLTVRPVDHPTTSDITIAPSAAPAASAARSAHSKLR